MLVGDRNLFVKYWITFQSFEISPVCNSFQGVADYSELTGGLSIVIKNDKLKHVWPFQRLSTEVNRIWVWY